MVSLRLRPGLALLVALMLSMIACSGGADASPASTAEDIAIAADRNVYVQRFDGPRRPLVTVTAHGVYPLQPRWSRDGTRLAYVQRRFFTGAAEADWGDDLYVQPLAGGAPVLVREHRQRGQMVEGVTWTPDGKALLLGETRPGLDGNPFLPAASRIVRFEVASGTERVLVEDAYEPSVSADGKRLAYLRGWSGAALVTSAADGSKARVLVSAATFVVVRSPRISPDGRTVLFVAPAEGAATRAPRIPFGGWLARLLLPSRAEEHGLPGFVWAVDVETGAPRQVTDFAMDDPSPAWLSNGEAIAILAPDGVYRALPSDEGIQRAEGGLLGQMDAR